MLIVGIALLIVAALIEFAGISVIGALALTGFGFIVLGLLIGESLPTRRS